MKCLFIINPVSGKAKGRAIFHQIKPIFEKASYSITLFQSTAKEQICDLGRSMKMDEYDRVVIVGGDGTLNEFVNGMKARVDQKIIPIGIIPAGTGNSLLHDLGMLDPIVAAKQIVKSGSRRIDMARIRCGEEVNYAFNVVGWGLPSTINQKSENWKFLAGQRYNMASLQEIIRNPKWPVKITLENELIEGDYSFFMACNTIHTGRGMKIAPSARLDDGLFDVVMLKNAPRHKLIGLFSKIFKGEHIGDPLVEYRQVQRFGVSCTDSSKLIIDGQIAGCTPFEAEILKEELELLN